MHFHQGQIRHDHDHGDQKGAARCRWVANQTLLPMAQAAAPARHACICSDEETPQPQVQPAATSPSRRHAASGRAPTQQQRPELEVEDVLHCISVDLTLP
jgi:hypothetical protein